MRVVEACQLCKLDNTRDNLIRAAMSQLKLAGSKQIQVVHMAEALQYRPKSMAG